MKLAVKTKATIFSSTVEQRMKILEITFVETYKNI